MNRRNRLNSDPLSWLLEPDADNPGVRYFALRDLLGLAESDPEVIAARDAVMATGPVPAILAAQHSDGSWGLEQYQKYRGTSWQLPFLAELGAGRQEPRIQRACDWILSHAIAASGALSHSPRPTPSQVVVCYSGNMLWALLRLGAASDPRSQTALNWLALAVQGDASVRYYRSTTAGPLFACGINLGQSCGWGATKVARALAAVPRDLVTPAVERAREVTAEFLLSRDLSAADYPYTERVSSTWFRFGFPSSYWSDILETADALAGLGYGADPRLANAYELILSKQDEMGRWRLENTLNGKTWVDIETKGAPSKWVTLRALRVLSAPGS